MLDNATAINLFKEAIHEVIEVVYLCDRRACEEGCGGPPCEHTTDIRHARNFESFNMGDRVIFVERNDDEETTDFEDGQGEQSVSSETLG